MARRNFYTNPGVVQQDFGAFARGVASTFRPAKRAEFKGVDLQAFDPIEKNAFYEVDGVKYDINEDAFLLANERFVNVINTQRDEFQKAHGNKRAQAEIQKDMLGYNDVNKFGAAFDALENVEEFDSNLQFFFPDENGNATNISAGELGKILSSNANALSVAKKQNKNGITHYGYEVQTDSGKVFLSGTSINDDYLSSNLKENYNQTSIVDALAKKYRSNRKTIQVKAIDGNTYVSPDSIKMDNFDAMRVANEVFSTNSNYSEMFPSAQRKYNQAVKNGEFVSANSEASDLDKMKEYISQEYLLRSAPDAYVRSEGVTNNITGKDYPKGYAIPLTEANKILFTTDTFVPKDEKGDKGISQSGIKDFYNTINQAVKTEDGIKKLIGTTLTLGGSGNRIVDVKTVFSPGFVGASDFSGLVVSIDHLGLTEGEEPPQFNLGDKDDFARLVRLTNGFGQFGKDKSGRDDINAIISDYDNLSQVTNIE